MVNYKPVIRVAIADDHRIFRMGVVACVGATPGISIDIEAENGLDLVNKIKNAPQLPDICLLDINMPKMNGFEVFAELKKRWPDIKVLVLSVFTMERYIVRMIMLGAGGYLFKNCDPAEIGMAIQAIYNTGVYYNGQLTRSFVHDIQQGRKTLPLLTEKELQVLRYCCSDLSYAQIGALMGVTTKSVEGHKDRLFVKLNANSRITLALLAVQFGLVFIEDILHEQNNFLHKKTQPGL